MRTDPANTPYKLASDVPEITKTLRITPHGITKISPFEAHMGRKPITPLYNLTTTSSPTNLSWEKAKHANLYRKNLTKVPLRAKIMHEVAKKLKQTDGVIDLISLVESPNKMEISWIENQKSCNEAENTTSNDVT